MDNEPGTVRVGVALAIDREVFDAGKRIGCAAVADRQRIEGDRVCRGRAVEHDRIRAAIEVDDDRRDAGLIHRADDPRAAKVNIAASGVVGGDDQCVVGAVAGEREHARRENRRDCQCPPLFKFFDKPATATHAAETLFVSPTRSVRTTSLLP
jgi:hypothetical protein